MIGSTSRRGFVVSGAAAALGAGLLRGRAAEAQTAAGTALPKSPVRLGVASYTFRKFGPDKLIEMMHELKCPYLNLKDIHLKMGSADEVKQQADTYRAAGLELTAAGAIYFPKNDEADVRSKFEYVKAAGIPMIVGSPAPEVLPLVEKYVKQYDVKLAIHNHGPEDKLWPSPLDVLQSIKGMDPRIGCCVDVGHTMRAGTDVVDAMRQAGPRLLDVHMKDLAQPKVKESQVAVGEGVMPVRAIFEQLVRMKYRGFVDLEYEIKEDDPMPGVLESFAYMRGVLTGMGYNTAE